MLAWKQATFLNLENLKKNDDYLISYLEIRYCELPPELVERDLARLLKANARPLGGEDREWERAAEVN